MPGGAFVAGLSSFCLSYSFLFFLVLFFLVFTSLWLCGRHSADLERRIRSQYILFTLFIFIFPFFSETLSQI